VADPLETVETAADAFGVQHVEIVDSMIDVAALTTMVEHNGVGAISLFLGTVRDLNDGRDVSGIDYEAYQPMAERELHAIARETCELIPGLRLAIEHRIGSLRVGEVSVAIAAAHAHRGPALAGAQRAIEQLKQRVPIWKREHYVDGERAWVDPTANQRPSQP
jgi:molybdopterin synthase catalytic subunit